MSNSLLDIPDEEVPPPSEGEWAVPTRNTTFSPRLLHGLSGPVILLARPRLGGWKPFGHQHLSHQTYTKKIESYLDNHDTPTEIDALDVDAGERVTIWAAENHDPLNPKPDDD